MVSNKKCLCVIISSIIWVKIIASINFNSMLNYRTLSKAALAFTATAFVTLAAGFDGADLRSAAGRVARSMVDAPVRVPAAGTVETAFSPKGGAEGLVVRVIDAARVDIKVLAYAFTSARVTQALLRARKRGVSVALVVDENHNLSRESDGRARAALSALSTAGADVRVVSAFAIHHDKLILSDSRHVQTGSFNYTVSAETRNSEYVMVNWDNPALAEAFLPHFKRNQSLATQFSTKY